MILIYLIITYFQMSSVTFFTLDHSKFCFSGNGLDGCELKSRNQTEKKYLGKWRN